MGSQTSLRQLIQECFEGSAREAVDANDLDFRSWRDRNAEPKEAAPGPQADVTERLARGFADLKTQARVLAENAIDPNIRADARRLLSEIEKSEGKEVTQNV